MTGWLSFIPDPGEHGTAASIGHYLELDLLPANNALALLTAVLRIMQVQVQREDGFQDTRIYNGWLVYASSDRRVVGKRDRAFPGIFFFLSPHILSHGSLPVRHENPSRERFTDS